MNPKSTKCLNSKPRQKTIPKRWIEKYNTNVCPYFSCILRKRTKEVYEKPIKFNTVESPFRVVSISSTVNGDDVGQDMKYMYQIWRWLLITYTQTLNACRFHWEMKRKDKRLGYPSLHGYNCLQMGWESLGRYKLKNSKIALGNSYVNKIFHILEDPVNRNIVYGRWTLNVWNVQRAQYLFTAIFHVGKFNLAIVWTWNLEFDE